MNQPFLLFQVQKIDTEIDLINKRLLEISRLLSENQAVSAAEETLAQANLQLSEAKNRLKSIEDAVEKVQIKIQNSESALYGGKIRLPKELQDLQSEISSLKKHLSGQEDLELEAIMAVEDSDRLVATAGGVVREDQYLAGSVRIQPYRAAGGCEQRHEARQLRAGRSDPPKIRPQTSGLQAGGCALHARANPLRRLRAR